jgi:hypothetical protein
MTPLDPAEKAGYFMRAFAWVHEMQHTLLVPAAVPEPPPPAEEVTLLAKDGEEFVVSMEIARSIGAISSRINSGEKGKIILGLESITFACCP